MSAPGTDDQVHLRAGEDRVVARVLSERVRGGTRELVVVVADATAAHGLRAHPGPLLLERVDPRGVREVPVRLDPAAPAAPEWLALHVPLDADVVVRQRRRWARARVAVLVELTAPDPEEGGQPAERTALDVSACGVRWREDGDGPGVGAQVRVRLHLPTEVVEGVGQVVRCEERECAAEVTFDAAAADRVAAFVFDTQRRSRRTTR